MSEPLGQPRVRAERLHATLQVADLWAALDFYTTRLGFAISFTWPDADPHFAGVKLGEVETFLMTGTPGPAGITLNFIVDDADALFAHQQANGVTVDWAPADREYGLRDFQVRDLDGYALRFGHYIYGVGEPVRIERVDVPIRLEKRLAALVDDLAAHKRMSRDSLLEEILLHTCEPWGDGVASPHTRSQLSKIQELKAKHGIDYDTHASYRFMEDTDD